MLYRIFLAHLAAIALLAGVPVVATAQNPIQALPDCQGKPMSRPSSVIFACGDGGVYASSVHWINWGAGFATATATMHANDCTPNCAQGHFHTYAAYLAVTGRERCRDGEWAYSKQAYSPRSHGVPGPSSHLDWLDTLCH